MTASLILAAALAQVGPAGLPKDRPAFVPKGKVQHSDPPTGLVGPADPTKPAMVTLDFRDRPITEVASAIASRSGSALDLQNVVDPGNNPRKITLVDPDPIPFWEAVDRFSIAAGLQGTLNDGGGTRRRAVVTFASPGIDPGPACYSGPFRFGKLTLHADYAHEFVPSRPHGSGDEAPYRAEFQVLAEPRVVAVGLGPLTDLEAIDDRGISLLDPKANGPEALSGPVSSFDLGTFRPVWKIRLAPPRAGSTRLKLLKGVMVAEVGVPPGEPSLTIPLEGASGKTFTEGDVAITVEEFRDGPNGLRTLQFVARITGDRGPKSDGPRGVAWARSSALARLIAVVDAEGHEAQSSSGSTSPGEELRVQYVFPRPIPGAALSAKPPTHLRYFAPRWVRAEVPFHFGDVPLP